MKEKIAVAILNWNGKALLEKYLPGVVEDSKPHPVYVIDNDSSDDSVAYVEEHFPEVQIIQTGENLGYAGGYNEG
ncbi:MAG: glycosyltransferase, partial [Cryomorphaceae bacterium]